MAVQEVSDGRMRFVLAMFSPFALVSVEQLWHSMQLATLFQDLQEVLQGCEPMLKTGRGLTKYTPVCMVRPAGVETMSNNPMAWEGGINERVGEFPKAQGCLMPMGVTSENVAAAFGVTRYVMLSW